MTEPTTIVDEMIVDSVSPYSDRRGVSRLNVSLVNENPPGPGGVVQPFVGMPTSLVIENPTDADTAAWKSGARVRRTYAVVPESEATGDSTSRS